MGMKVRMRLTNEVLINQHGQFRLYALLLLSPVCLSSHVSLPYVFVCFTLSLSCLSVSLSVSLFVNFDNTKEFYKLYTFLHFIYDFILCPILINYALNDKEEFCPLFRTEGFLHVCKDYMTRSFYKG